MACVAREDTVSNDIPGVCINVCFLIHSRCGNSGRTPSMEVQPHSLVTVCLSALISDVGFQACPLPFDINGGISKPQSISIYVLGFYNVIAATFGVYVVGKFKKND
jgi:hypothetical protein